MGLFFDTIKRIFKKDKAIIAADLGQYERNERPEHPFIVDAKNWGGLPIGAIDEQWERQIDPKEYKKSSGKDLELLKTTYVGYCGKYNHRVTIRKMKSQRRNWKKWRKKLWL